MPWINRCRDIHENIFITIPSAGKGVVDANGRFTVRKHKKLFQPKSVGQETHYFRNIFRTFDSRRWQNFTSGSCRKSVTRGRYDLWNFFHSHVCSRTMKTISMDNWQLFHYITSFTSKSMHLNRERALSRDVKCEKRRVWCEFCEENLKISRVEACALNLLTEPTQVMLEMW